MEMMAGPGEEEVKQNITGKKITEEIKASARIEKNRTMKTKMNQCRTMRSPIVVPKLSPVALLWAAWVPSQRGKVLL